MYRVLTLAGVEDVVLVDSSRNVERAHLDDYRTVFVVDDPSAAGCPPSSRHSELASSSQVILGDERVNRIVTPCRQDSRVPHVHLSTSASLPELTRAVTIVSPDRTAQIPGGRHHLEHEDRAPRLSSRERHVLLSWLRNGSKVAVACELAITVSTVDTYLARIRRKYDRVGRKASNKTLMAARALEDGIIDLDMIC